MGRLTDDRGVHRLGFSWFRRRSRRDGSRPSSDGSEGLQRALGGAAAAATFGGERDFRRFCLSRCWEGYARLWDLVVGPGSRAIRALCSSRVEPSHEAVGVLSLRYVCGQTSRAVGGREDSCSCRGARLGRADKPPAARLGSGRATTTPPKRSHELVHRCSHVRGCRSARNSGSNPRRVSSISSAAAPAAPA